ncbi:hypothetical protein [Streptomyces coelicoflavus]|uniref:hypothetical protein n=1 Tax=Streptomyces coelicoflavus TaxID=285562 RepID=UPI002E25C034
MWSICHLDAQHGLIEDATAHDLSLAQQCQDDYVQHGLIPRESFLLPSNSQPRVITSGDLDSWTCPADGLAATSGVVYLEERGPFQQIAVRRFICPSTHRWSDETDGS